MVNIPIEAKIFSFLLRFAPMIWLEKKIYTDKAILNGLEISIRPDAFILEGSSENPEKALLTIDIKNMTYYRDLILEPFQITIEDMMQGISTSYLIKLGQTTNISYRFFLNETQKLKLKESLGKSLRLNGIAIFNTEKGRRIEKPLSDIRIQV